MLSEIRIRGLGVICEAVLELAPGFTVVTGETGAGKTMVVTGLHLLGGGRADASRVRSGADRAVVEGWFDAPADGGGGETLAEVGAEADENGSLICARTVNADGRSRAHIGGRSVPAATLAELSEHLLAVHGQNDQLRLLRAASRRELLDRFAGEAVAEPLAHYRELRSEWLELSRELTERTERSRELAREADLLRHGLAEIAEVDPREGEDADLVAEARRLADVDELRVLADAAQQALAGEGADEPSDGGALGRVAEARKRLAGAEDPALTDLGARLDEAAALLGDASADLGGYLDGLQADPQRLEQVLERQAELKSLTRKYAADVDGVLAWAADAEQRLSGMDTSQEALDELARRRDACAGSVAEQAERVSVARASAGETLARAVTGELAGLAMPGAVLDVAVRPHEAEASDTAALRVGGQLRHAGADGTDEVELLLRPHRGAEPLPLSKSASGGELSRVMLALEVVLAHSDPVPTMVFDEVDAGVGGRAAVEIGRRLASLARSHQVLVVTHLPQVAAYADRHLVVDKTDDGTVTESAVRGLSEQQRVTELARMLAGMDSTDTGKAHAEELLAAAGKDKNAGAAKRKSAPKRSKSRP